MTREEALQILRETPGSDRPSRLNPALTINQGLNIVTKAVEHLPEGSTLPGILEKRVMQISRNQKRPRRAKP